MLILQAIGSEVNLRITAYDLNPTDGIYSKNVKTLGIFTESVG